MSALWNRLKDKLRDRTREDLCDRLNAIGVPAKLAPLGRPEESLTTDHGKSLGLIELQGSALQWVVVKRDLEGERAAYFFEYGVPDDKINGYFPRTKLTAMELRGSALFGAVVAVKWVGPSAGSLSERLERDDENTRLLLDNGGCSVEAFPQGGCWIITAHRAPNAPIFRAYMRIAAHLLAPV